ncbi:MAG TPA: hypothetical protein VGB30_15015 [bacterium]
MSRCILSLILFASFSLITGCSHPSEPTTPIQPVLNNQPRPISSNSGHSLLSYTYIYFDQSDPEKIEFEIIPVRDSVKHWNIRSFLENSPCSDCFSITGIAPSGNGTLLVDIEISGPFANLNFSGFDVRGIAYFNGNHNFPESGLSFSDRDFGDGEIVNADGYSTLYNSDTEGNGLEGYSKGKFATLAAPDASLGGYRRFITDDPLNTRNAFYAGDAVAVTYEVDMPDSLFIMGYAIDASWAPPIETPVDDVMADFGPEANCPEPWKIEVDTQNIGPWDPAIIVLDVYDYDGMNSHGNPVLECPEVFSGTLTASLVSEETGYTRYEVSVENTMGVPDGQYRCLISVEANENDPGTKPWLDLTSYQVFNLGVAQNFDLTDVTPPYLNAETEDYFIHDNKLFMSAGVRGIQIYDISDPANVQWIQNIPIPGAITYDAVIDGDYIYAVGFNIDLIVIDINPLVEANIVSATNFDGASFCIAINGTTIYLGSSTYPDGRIVIVDASDPLNPVETGSAVFSGFAREIQYKDGYVYQATDPGLSIIDVDPPETASEVQFVSIATMCFSVELDGDYAYACDYLAEFHIIDITDPPTASVINNVSVPGGTYMASVDNGYAYVASTGEGIQVIDIDPPGSASVVANLPANWFTKECIASGNLLIAGAYGGFISADISNPLSPSTQDAIFYPSSVYGGTAYENGMVLGNNESGILFLDTSIPESATVAKRLSMTGSYATDVEGDYAYVLTNAGLQIIDITSPGSESIINTIFYSGSKMQVMVESGYAYIAGGPDGLVIIDVDPPGAAYVVNTVPSAQEIESVTYQGGYVHAGTSIYPDYAYRVFDVDPPAAASEIFSYVLDDDANSLIADGDYLYIANGEQGLTVFDISDPTSPVFEVTLDITGLEATSIDKVNDVVFIGDYSNGLIVVDVTDPLAPVEIADITTPGYTLDLSVYGQYAYVSALTGGVSIIKLW